MGNALSGLFGNKPSAPDMVRQPTPVEKLQQSNVANEAVRKELAKKRRATILAQQSMAEPAIKRQTLGAGV